MNSESSEDNRERPATGRVREDRDVDRLIDQRDMAEDFIGEVYREITGESPQWSNAFGYAEAREEIREALAQIRGTHRPRPREIEIREELVYVMLLPDDVDIDDDEAVERWFCEQDGAAADALEFSVVERTFSRLGGSPNRQFHFD